MLVNFSYLKQPPPHLIQVNKTLLGLWEAKVGWCSVEGEAEKKKYTQRGRNGALQVWERYPSQIQLSIDQHKQVRKLWSYRRKYLKKFLRLKAKDMSQNAMLEIESVIGTWTTVASFKYGGKETGDRGCGWPLEAENHSSEDRKFWSTAAQNFLSMTWMSLDMCSSPEPQEKLPCCHLDSTLYNTKHRISKPHMEHRLLTYRTVMY